MADVNFSNSAPESEIGFKSALLDLLRRKARNSLLLRINRHAGLRKLGGNKCGSVIRNGRHINPFRGGLATTTKTKAGPESIWSRGGRA